MLIFNITMITCKFKNSNNHEGYIDNRKSYKIKSTTSVPQNLRTLAPFSKKNP